MWAKTHFAANSVGAGSNQHNRGYCGLLYIAKRFYIYIYCMRVGLALSKLYCNCWALCGRNRKPLFEGVTVALLGICGHCGAHEAIYAFVG